MARGGRKKVEYTISFTQRRKCTDKTVVLHGKPKHLHVLGQDDHREGFAVHVPEVGNDDGPNRPASHHP